MLIIKENVNDNNPTVFENFPFKIKPNEGTPGGKVVVLSLKNTDKCEYYRSYEYFELRSGNIIVYNKYEEKQL